MPDAVKAADDAFAQMVAFLNVAPPRFTEGDRESLKRDAELLARMTAQLDAGQRGSGVSFEAAPFVFVRCAVYVAKLAASGAIDRLEVDQ